MSQQDKPTAQDILLQLIEDISSIRAGKTFTPTDYADPALAQLHTRILDEVINAGEMVMTAEQVEKMDEIAKYREGLRVQQRAALARVFKGE